MRSGSPTQPSTVPDTHTLRLYNIRPEDPNPQPTPGPRHSRRRPPPSRVTKSRVDLPVGCPWPDEVCEPLPLFVPGTHGDVRTGHYEVPSADAPYGVIQKERGVGRNDRHRRVPGVLSRHWETRSLETGVRWVRCFRFLGLLPEPPPPRRVVSVGLEPLHRRTALYLVVEAWGRPL